jgi:hypothetical protein
MVLKIVVKVFSTYKMRKYKFVIINPTTKLWVPQTKKEKLYHSLTYGGWIT